MRSGCQHSQVLGEVLFLVYRWPSSPCILRWQREISLSYLFFFFFLKNFFNVLFILFYLFFWLCWVFVAARGLSSSCGERGLLFVAVCRLLTAVDSLVAEHGLQAHRLQQSWHASSVVVACGLQSAGSVVVGMGLVVPQHVGSSRTRARTHVPCIGRQILNHCTTREALIPLLLKALIPFMRTSPS